MLALLLTPNLEGQGISIEVFVHNHHTYAPLDSAFVKILRDGIILDSSYTNKNGRTQLTIRPTGVGEKQSGIPNTFTISDNYPNPFSDETQVDFSIPESQTVRVDIYNIIGQRVFSEELPLSSGSYSMNLSISHLTNGIYFLRLQGMEQQTIKLMKVGGDVQYDTRQLGRGSIQVTSRGGINFPLLKNYEKNEEFIIQVEKGTYEMWSTSKQIESDTEINVPLVLSAEYLLTDIDGNLYQTVKIGEQWWMAENLKVLRYRNGDAIPTGLSQISWNNTTEGAYSIYPHGEADGINSVAEMLEAYGALYNWYAVNDSRGLCPSGWHVPTDEEWTLLEMYLAMSEEEEDLWGWGTENGSKIKSTRTEPEQHPRWDAGNPRWDLGNRDATNESGFSALPGGDRDIIGYSYIGARGSFWSSTECWVRAYLRDLGSHERFISREEHSKNYGYSVRCLRDD